MSKQGEILKPIPVSKELHAMQIPVGIDTMLYTRYIKTGTDCPWQCFEQHTIAVAGPTRALAGCCGPCSRYAGRCRALATVQGVASALPLQLHGRGFSTTVAAPDQAPKSSQKRCFRSNTVLELVSCAMLLWLAKQF